MFNKFKNNEIVLITGYGKENNDYYENVIAQIICRDPFYLDYFVQFPDGTEDWFDGIFIKKYEGD